MFYSLVTHAVLLLEDPTCLCVWGDASKTNVEQESKQETSLDVQTYQNLYSDQDEVSSVV